MIITFETTYGKIECNRQTGKAYFFTDDYESDIDTFGYFKDQWGRMFAVAYPQRLARGESAPARLSVWEPREIAVIP